MASGQHFKVIKGKDTSKSKISDVKNYRENMEKIDFSKKKKKEDK